LAEAAKKETQATGMKFVLRNNGGSHHVANARQASRRRASRSTLKSSGTHVAGAVLAAVALAVTGCSADEGSEPDIITGPAIEDAPF
jgi:hypothetical protein